MRWIPAVVGRFTARSHYNLAWNILEHFLYTLISWCSSSFEQVLMTEYCSSPDTVDVHVHASLPTWAIVWYPSKHKVDRMIDLGTFSALQITLGRGKKKGLFVAMDWRWRKRSAKSLHNLIIFCFVFNQRVIHVIKWEDNAHSLVLCIEKSRHKLVYIHHLVLVVCDKQEKNRSDSSCFYSLSCI